MDSFFSVSIEKTRIVFFTLRFNKLPQLALPLLHPVQRQKPALLGKSKHTQQNKKRKK